MTFLSRLGREGMDARFIRQGFNVSQRVTKIVTEPINAP
jgi:hypothetical protein